MRRILYCVFFMAGTCSFVLAGTPKPASLAALGPGRLILPTRAASYTLVDGRMVMTSEWVELGGATTRDIYRAAFDSIELDLTGGVLGAPTDQANPPGPTGCPDETIPNGNRWYLGSSYSNPFVSADINGAVPGAACEGLGLHWFRDVGDSEPDINGDGRPDSPLYIAVQQFEDMDVVGCSNDGSGFIDGVIYDFNGIEFDPNWYNYTTISLNGSGLFHTMPADGAGGYQVIYGIAFDPVSGTITIPAPIDPITGLGVNIQPMLWGTGANEAGAPDDGRRGVDIDGQFDDDAPVNGVHDLALECNSYLYGVCPDPLAAATGFYYKCSCPCSCLADVDGDNIVQIADLALFLSVFGSQPLPPDFECADMNGDGVVDFADLGLFLTLFGTTCP